MLYSVIQTTVTICTNQLPYTWNSLSLAAAGTYSDTLTSAAGCDSIATLILNVNAVLRDTTTVTICTNSCHIHGTMLIIHLQELIPIR